MNLKKYCMSKYIVFDFDGTIVDSEKEYFKAWKKAAEEYGYFLTDEQLLDFRSADKSLTYHLFGSLENYNKVREKRKEIINNFLTKGKFSLKCGIKETLEYLYDKGYFLIIATSGDPNIVNEHLDYYDLKKYFIDVLSVRNLSRGKPYPDIYIEVCNHYELNPLDVLVIEDSPNGIKSASAAGCNVIMIPDQTKLDKELEDKVICSIDSALELAKYL